MEGSGRAHLDYRLSHRLMPTCSDRWSRFSPLKLPQLLGRCCLGSHPLSLSPPSTVWRIRAPRLLGSSCRRYLYYCRYIQRWCLTEIPRVSHIPRILALPSASSAAAPAVDLVDGCSALSVTLRGSMRRFLPRALNCFEVILERAALPLERGAVGIYV
jgi:hypothetical protein